MTMLATQPWKLESTLSLEEDVVELALADRMEVVEGELKEKVGMSLESSDVLMELGSRIRIFIKPEKLGTVVEGHTSYQCFPHKPDQIRRPDVSFIRRGRLTPDMRHGHVPIAPDLIVEVVSPNDAARDIQSRVDDFLDAGTPLAVVIYPENRMAWIYRGDGSATRVDKTAELELEPVLPGFHCTLGELFAGVDVEG